MFTPSPLQTHGDYSVFISKRVPDPARRNKSDRKPSLFKGVIASKKSALENRGEVCLTLSTQATSVLLTYPLLSAAFLPQALFILRRVQPRAGPESAGRHDEGIAQPERGDGRASDWCLVGMESDLAILHPKTVHLVAVKQMKDCQTCP
jgi:hypothetical protein